MLFLNPGLFAVISSKEPQPNIGSIYNVNNCIVGVVDIDDASLCEGQELGEAKFLFLWADVPHQFTTFGGMLGCRHFRVYHHGIRGRYLRSPGANYDCHR